MREALDILERLSVAYFVTGSEAAACYGVIRTTFDMDVVIDLAPSRFPTLAAAFENRFAISDPIDYPEFSMASVISQATADKVDLIMRRPSPWSNSCMERRARRDHPRYGSMWVASLEDLILAKLVWSEGTSELQLRDCAALIRISGAGLDWPYLDRWAATLDVTALLKGVRDAP